MRKLVNNITNIQCFESIELFEPIINKTKVRVKVSIKEVNGNKSEFNLRIKYDEPIAEENDSLLKIAAIMPLLNYGLFSNEIKVKYKVTKSDLSLVNDLLQIFSKDILINKFLRKENPYLLSKNVKSSIKGCKWKDINKAKIIPSYTSDDIFIKKNVDKKACGVLSSGGKESLLTYGMLKEIGAIVHPLYVNESGGHWRTALPAYRKFVQMDPNTTKVWTNIDRFYTFMLDHMRIIRKNHRQIWADTYPVRLCIFPFYIFILLPIFIKRNIGNLLLGSEFDDPRISPYFNGIRHFFGTYDQSQDFDIRMNNWYSKRIRGLQQWSAVRSISGLIVERILARRYPQLSRLQRSCHSCQFFKGDFIPCGKCSKCLGVLLFLIANNINPEILKYRTQDIVELQNRLFKTNLKLDEDEKNYSLYLARFLRKINDENILHIETIHVNKLTNDLTLMPTDFRFAILKILKSYTKGFSILKNNSWIITPQPINLVGEA